MNPDNNQNDLPTDDQPLTPNQPPQQSVENSGVPPFQSVEQPFQPINYFSSEQTASQPAQKKKQHLLLWLSLAAIFFILGAATWFFITNNKADTDQQTARNHFLASSNVDTIASSLEFFFATSKYYPSDIDSMTLEGLGVQVDRDVQTPPPNVKYVYTPFPTGCTTIAKTCTSYQLSAVDVVTDVDINTVRAKSGM